MRKKTLTLGHQMLRSGGPPKFHVSVKAVLIHDGRVALAKNERKESELPGGKLEFGEDPEACVVREVKEELGLRVTVSRTLDSWQYRVAASETVVIITYACECTRTELTRSPEHKEVGWFSLDEVPSLPLPGGYKKSVAKWASILQRSSPAKVRHPEQNRLRVV